MKQLFIYLLVGMTGLTACHHRKHLSYKSGTIMEEPMYVTDRKVEEFRQNSGISVTNNNLAEGPGSGYSYSSYGSRQEVLNTMGKYQSQVKKDSSQLSNMRSYSVSDTIESDPMR